MAHVGFELYGNKNGASIGCAHMELFNNIQNYIIRVTLRFLECSIIIEVFIETADFKL